MLLILGLSLNLVNAETRIIRIGAGQGAVDLTAALDLLKKSRAEWSVPLKNWTGNKLDLEPHFRHLIGRGGTP